MTNRFSHLSVLSIAALAVFFDSPAVANRLGDFALIDHQGKFHQLTRYGHQKAIVLIAQANGCELIPESLPRLNKMRQDWENSDVSFLMINSTGIDSRQEITTEATVYDLNYPILQDHNQLVAESLGINSAGEILVIDPTNMKLVFHGPLDERKRRRSDPDKPTPLADAIGRVVAGEAQNADAVVVDRNPGGSASECAYQFANRSRHQQNPPDYAAGVAPILQENCVHCHRSGGIGPFAMDSYQMVRGFSPMMR
jgi:peroxiredoxin